MATNEQKEVPASVATQLDPVNAPEDYQIADSDLVMDPDTRGWVTHDRVKDWKEESKKAEQKAAADSHKTAEKEAKASDKEESSGPYGETVPDELNEGRKRDEETAEEQQTNADEAAAENAEASRGTGRAPRTRPAKG